MKGFLRSSQGLFQLAPKITTVGREGCDLVLQSSSVDQQHALLECRPEEGCFVLIDLNTINGTFVNDCRVENASVKLCSGDILRFGNSSSTFELVVEHQQTLTYPPVVRQSAWVQPITIIADQTTHPDVIYQRGLPHLKSVIATTTQTFTNSPSGTPPLPRPPPTTRSRPLSAGAPRRQLTERIAQVPMQKCNTSGWVSGGLLRSSSSSDLQALQEKELKLERLEEEMRRLSVIETDCLQKDELINQLYQEINRLQQSLRSAESRAAASFAHDADFTEKLNRLEAEIVAKREEVTVLKNKINSLRANESQHLTYRADEAKEISRLKDELERTQRDKWSTDNQLGQLEAKLADRENQTEALRKEIDRLKQELDTKDSEKDQLIENIHHLQSNSRTKEEVEEKEKQLQLLEKKLTDMTSLNEEHQGVIGALKDNLDEKSKLWQMDKELMEKLQNELEVKRAEFEAMIQGSHSEKNRITAEFNNFVEQIRAAITTSGLQNDSDEFDVLDVSRKAFLESHELRTVIRELKEQMSESQRTNESFDQLRQHLSEIVTSLSFNGYFAKELKLEITAARSRNYPFEMDDEVNKLFVQLLEGQLEWVKQIEETLESHGIELGDCAEALCRNITDHLSCLSDVEKELQAAKSELEESRELHKTDMEAVLNSVREDLLNKYKLELEKIKSESEDTFSQAMEDIKALEVAKRMDAVKAERDKIDDLEKCIESVKMALAEKEKLEEDHEKVVRNLNDIMKENEMQEHNFHVKISQLEEQLRESADKQKTSEVDAKYAKEISEYQEQIRQHALTICAMEEQLNKAANKTKDYQSEITSLKTNITELQSRPPVMQPTPPLKPRMIVQQAPIDGSLLQQTLMHTQKENLDYKRQLQEQQHCIMALRRDLAGATARLSDVNGELTETQKQQLEQYRATMKQQEEELVTLQQQMVKLTQIIDKLTEEIKDLTDEANKQKADANKYKNLFNDKDAKVRQLQEELDNTKSETSSKLSIIEDEGRASSELSVQGAQCRGERHEQVIIRQREALSELRARVRALEQGDIPLLSQSEALQSIAFMRKELEELRAIQACKTQLDETFGGAISSYMDVTQISTLKDVTEAFELSENLYLSLLRAVASCVDLDEVGGMRSLINISRDERQRLAAEREQACEHLANLVKSLKDRVQRKDELLQAYEKDLAKLRHAENLTEWTSGKVDSVTSELLKKNEELHCLRETLQRTRDRLEQEKRLNTAIKQKKTFHLENEQPHVHKNGWPKHQCLPDDPHADAIAKKKTINEKKRRNYEKEMKMKDMEASLRRNTFSDHSANLELA